MIIYFHTFHMRAHDKQEIQVSTVEDERSSLKGAHVITYRANLTIILTSTH